MSLTSRIMLKISETGLLPEKLLSIYLNRACKKAVENASLGNIEARQSVFRQIVKEINSGTNINREMTDQHSATDLGDAFFSKFLGKRLSFTSGYYSTGAECLDEAEETMLWMFADKARTRDEMEILVISSDYGACSIWLAKQFPKASITASASCIKTAVFLQKQRSESGLKNLSVITSDIDELPTDKRFDRIIIVDSFNRIINNNKWQQNLSSLLNDDGLVFIQEPVHSSYSFYSAPTGFDLLPGNSIKALRIILSSEAMLMFQKYFSIEDHWKISGTHYSKTADNWLKKFDANRCEILPLIEKSYGKKISWITFQRWRHYLLKTREQFAINSGQQWILGQYLFKKRSSS